MKIGAKLAELRRKKGLTQEQLADQLGVSAPAVSKWETDNTYPDITLLCPLARALGSNVDTLLRFEEQLSSQEVVDKVNAAMETARLEGWEAGQRLLDELLRQYPNSEALKYNAALAQNVYRMLYPEADQELQRQWTARKTELLREVQTTGSREYWESATLMLAQTAAAEGRLDEAENLLKELPEQAIDSTSVRAQIHLRRGEPEEALKVIQKRLHTLVWQVQSCLGAILFPDVTDTERALEVCRVYQAVDRLFGLGGLYDGLFFEVYVKAGRWEEAADRLERYVDATLRTITAPRSELFSPGVETAERPASSREVRLLLLKGLEKGEEYLPVLQSEKARAALERLRASLDG